MAIISDENARPLEAAFREIVSLTRSLLAFQADLGWQGADIAPTLLQPHVAAPPVPAQKVTASPLPNVPMAQTFPRALKEVLPAVGAPASLPGLQQDIASCKRCGLASSRTHALLGRGPSNARVMFIAGAPNRDEDLQGEIGVGDVGALFDRMLKAIGLTRSDIYLVPALRCRPPKDRPFSAEEALTCQSLLSRQIAAIQPKILVLLGEAASLAVLGPESHFSSLCGTWQQAFGLPTLVTYAPAHLLATPADKRAAWVDLQALQARLVSPQGTAT